MRISIAAMAMPVFSTSFVLSTKLDAAVDD